MGAVAPHLRKESSSSQTRVTDHELIDKFYPKHVVFALFVFDKRKTKTQLAADVGADAAMINQRVFTA